MDLTPITAFADALREPVEVTQRTHRNWMSGDRDQGGEVSEPARRRAPLDQCLAVWPGRAACANRPSVGGSEDQRARENIKPQNRVSVKG